MKIRSGFVSNSSSSSFLIVGVTLEPAEFATWRKRFEDSDDYTIDGLSLVDNILGVKHTMYDGELEVIDIATLEREEAIVRKQLGLGAGMIKVYVGTEAN